MKTTMTLSQYIKSLRLQGGLTFFQVAKMVGIEEIDVILFESGKIDLETRKLIKIVEAVGGSWDVVRDVFKISGLRLTDRDFDVFLELLVRGVPCKVAAKIILGSLILWERLE